MNTEPCDAEHPGIAAPFDAEALRVAADRLGLRLVVRFGSRATGAIPPSTPGSDLDIAVLAGTRWVTLHELYDALADAFPGADLDLALLNTADPLFRYEVFRRSDLLFGDPDLYAEYQAYAYRDFMDSADLRALEDALSRRKLRRLLDAAA
ncbi:MAG TPA: nucleotidyltransferase domain-containing protein [Longimicrobiaceae bacterium]|nr:nucleotidyltransferase domain-containing protein [Longimicrobiaceae bacterium]